RCIGTKWSRGRRSTSTYSMRTMARSQIFLTYTCRTFAKSWGPTSSPPGEGTVIVLRAEHVSQLHSLAAATLAWVVAGPGAGWLRPDGVSIATLESIPAH